MSFLGPPNSRRLSGDGYKHFFQSTVTPFTIEGCSQLDSARLHLVIETKFLHDVVGYITLRDENPKNRNGDLAIPSRRTNGGKDLDLKHWRSLSIMLSTH